MVLELVASFDAEAGVSSSVLKCCVESVGAGIGGVVLMEVVELVELHRHRDNLSVAHVLEQNLAVAYDQAVGDVQGVTGSYLVWV